MPNFEFSIFHFAFRSVVCLVLLLTVAGCGKEAPPRAVQTAAPGSAYSDTPFKPTGVQSTAGADATQQTLAEPRGIGDPNAPITVVVYSDFQCPLCASFVEQTKPLIDKQYVETGKVYFVYRDFPLTNIHPSALLAAHAANCAADQGDFWGMHDQLFSGSGMGTWGGGPQADYATFVSYAQGQHLDVDTFKDCLATNKHADQIQTDFEDGLKHGIRGTPTFFINGRALVGAQPFPVWKQVLDEMLQH